MINEIYQWLSDQDDIKVIKTREPGGNKIAEQIRSIIVDKDNTDLDPIAEALLFAASRRQHLVNNIIPFLEDGYIVLCDRYVTSSIVYQGYARSLGVNEVQAMNEFATNGLMPDLTLWLDIKPSIGLRRINSNNRNTNRLDLESDKFHEDVRTGYRWMYHRTQDMFRLDAEQDLETVVKDCKRFIEQVIDKKCYKL